MCGILAAINSNQENDGALRNVMKLMNHRGPDFSSDSRIGSLWLGHNRLSIIDLDERSNQPMLRSNHGIIFNGEIYNFRSLKNQLGLTNLKTSSDTEVLLEGLKLNGVDFLNNVDGFFAFVFYNLTTQRVIVARDRLGQKPLYYAKSGDALYFSSEQRVLRKLLNAKVDSNYLLEIVVSGLPSSGSYLEGIREVKPGEYIELTFDGKVLKKALWFNLKEEIYKKRNDFKGFKYGDHVALLREQIVDSVSNRLVSDVEVVTINSGGLDSSLISSIAKSLNHDIKMYTLDVQGKSEVEFATMVSNHLKAALRVVDFNETIYDDLYDMAAYFLDGPMLHPNNVAIFKLAQLIRQDGYKVVLSGEIADELFFGYPSMNSVLKNRGALRLLKFVSYVFNTLPENIKNELFGEFKLFSREPSDSILKIVKDQNAIRRQRFENEVSEFCEFMPKEQAYAAAIRLLAIQDYLPPLLKRGDQMFMGNSVEARMPFSSRDILLHSFYIPERGTLNKKILKDVAKEFLPPEVIGRRKMGLPVNIKNANKTRILEELKSIIQ